MRPERLEMQGFSAFREPTVVDFDGAELFALTGPTGAGKSSILDAVVFALYGSVPRHGRRSVAPVVTQGLLESRVRLDFTIAGEPYTVARVVRKTARGGANTDEARLEHHRQTLAASAGEVDAAVEELLGLDYDQFTTCVVLPQGDFQRFLHARPADRQNLLVALLDLGIYERISHLAVGRQRHAEGRLTEIDATLAGLAGADDEARAAAANRVDRLDALRIRVEETVPELDKLEAEGRVRRTELDEATAHRDLLASLILPEGFTELADRLARARTTADQHVAEVEEARKEADAAEAALGGRSSGEIRRRIDQRTRLAAARERHRTATAEAAAAEEVAASAEKVQGEAATRLDEARRHDLAAALRTGLSPGDPCPVCLRPVDEIPHAEAAATISEAETSATQATRAAREAAARLTSATTALTQAETEVATLEADLVGVRDLDTLTADLENVDSLEAALTAARDTITQAEKALTRARTDLEALAGAEGQARNALIAARDSVAALGPPSVDLTDLAADWERLLAWARDHVPSISERVSDLSSGVEDLRRRYQDLDRSLREACREAGLTPADRPVRDVVVDALVAARAELERIEKELERSRNLTAERDGVAEQAVVAKDLARHLKANNFEKWLLDEALRVLAAGANRRLAELASGQYSLALSKKLEFEIVDHHAADERRSVRSLSGGETFLVSLALALSLADHIAEMAAVEATRLESIFLDEGFGTLDAETLETVASVITEIGATGKTVGIITHVKELAEQVPLRFEVSKTASGSRVERVES